MNNFAIGKVAVLSGVKVPTIRFYEQIGLLPSPRRSKGGQRRYRPETIARLRFIRHARALGFEIDAIRKLLALSGNRSTSCRAAEQLARDQVATIDVKLRRLKAVRAELLRMIAACPGRTVTDCRILEVLAEEE